MEISYFKAIIAPNLILAGAPPQTSLGKLTALLQIPDWNLRVLLLRREKEKEENGDKKKKNEKKKKEEKEKEKAKGEEKGKDGKQRKRSHAPIHISDYATDGRLLARLLQSYGPPAAGVRLRNRLKADCGDRKRKLLHSREACRLAKDIMQLQKSICYPKSKFYPVLLAVIIAAMQAENLTSVCISLCQSLGLCGV